MAVFAVFDQLPGADLKVLSTIVVLTVPDVTKTLSCARILNVGLFISHTEALF
jgi:hypothetical protein